MAWSKEVFAENLRFYMERSGKTQKELAEIVGVSAPTVNDWLKAKKYPRIDKVERLAKYFGILKSDLIEDKTEKSLINDDEELTEYLEALKTRPEMRMLFQISKDATKEDVEAAVRVIEAIRKK